MKKLLLSSILLSAILSLSPFSAGQAKAAASCSVLRDYQNSGAASATVWVVCPSGYQDSWAVYLQNVSGSPTFFNWSSGYSFDADGNFTTSKNLTPGTYNGKVICAAAGIGGTVECAFPHPLFITDPAGGTYRCKPAGGGSCVIDFASNFNCLSGYGAMSTCPGPIETDMNGVCQSSIQEICISGGVTPTPTPSVTTTPSPAPCALTRAQQNGPSTITFEGTCPVNYRDDHQIKDGATTITQGTVDPSTGSFSDLTTISPGTYNFTLYCNGSSTTSCTYHSQVVITPTPTPTVTPGTCSSRYDILWQCQVTDNCNSAAGYRCSLNVSSTPCPGNAGTTGSCDIVNVSPLIITPVPCSPVPIFGGNGLQTALGCVPTQLENIVPWLLRALAGIAGGIALLLLFYGGLTYIMAGGEKTGVEDAKGIITAAISGLLLVIFSVLILRIIGINILGIPAVTVGPNNGIIVPGV